MDIATQISKAHNYVLSNLSPKPLSLFNELTHTHQRYITSLLVGRDIDSFPDDVPIETTINDDIESCVEHLELELTKIVNDSAINESWNQWLFLKKNTSNIFAISELAKFIFFPYEPYDIDKPILGMEKTFANVLGGYWINDGLLKPYLYPWQTSIKNILFDKETVKSYRLKTPDESRLLYADLPIDIKKHTLVKLEDLKNTGEKIKISGKTHLHLLDIAQVWESYLIISPDGLPIPWLFKPNERKARFVGEMLEAAYRLYRAKYHQNPQDKNFAELFDLLTPQDLPEFVSMRSADSKASSIALKLRNNHTYQYKNFLTSIKKKLITP